MGADAEIRNLVSRIRQVVEAKVVGAAIVGRHVEVELRIVPDGQTVFADLLVSLGGGGGVFRVPTAGDTVLVGLVDGRPSNGYVLGFLPTDGAMPLPDGFEANTVYVQAPEGEPINIVTTGADVELSVDAGREIRLGGKGATDPVALSSKTDTNEGTIANIVSTHQHTYTLPLIPIGPAVTTPGAPPQQVPALPSTAAKKAKGE